MVGSTICDYTHRNFSNQKKDVIYIRWNIVLLRIVKLLEYNLFRIPFAL